MDKIKIGYKTYEIKKEKSSTNLFIEGSELYGQIDFKNKVITLNNDYDDEQLEVTLYHEILHGIDDMYNIDLTEKQVEMISKGIYILLTDNGLKVNKQ